MRGAILARVAEMQYAYEDRLADARAQLDRVTSRQLLDQNSFEGKVHELLSRQAQLEQRASIVATMAGQANQIGETTASLGDRGRQKQADAAAKAAPATALMAIGAAAGAAHAQPASDSVLEFGEGFRAGRARGGGAAFRQAASARGSPRRPARAHERFARRARSARPRRSRRRRRRSRPRRADPARLHRPFARPHGEAPDRDARPDRPVGGRDDRAPAQRDGRGGHRRRADRRRAPARRRRRRPLHSGRGRQGRARLRQGGVQRRTKPARRGPAAPRWCRSFRCASR